MFILCLSYVYRMFIVFRIMEIKLSPICESLTGSLGRGFGYSNVAKMASLQSGTLKVLSLPMVIGASSVHVQNSQK